MVDRVANIGRVQDRVRIPKPRRKTQMPRPPKVFQSALKTEYPSGLQLFLENWHFTGTTSMSEGYIYWAFQQVKGPVNTGGWGYQVSAGGGRSAGGAVADFMIWDVEPRIVVRIQTERFHVATTNRKQKSDEAQRRALERMGYTVIDIFEEHFLSDKTGAASIRLVKMALQRQEMPSPILSGTSLARPGANL